jgi:hypothetical protein
MWRYDRSIGNDKWVRPNGMMILEGRATENKKGRTKEGALSFRFDLWRGSSIHDDWEWADSALLIIAYSHNKNDPWDNEGLAINRGGQLNWSEGWEEYGKNLPLARGRMLASNLEEGNDWSKRYWIFALPLSDIRDRDCVEKYIVRPVQGLLGKKSPDEALADVPAIVWARNSK